MSNTSTFLSNESSRILTLEEWAYVVLGKPVEIISLLICFLSLIANLFSIASILLSPRKMVTHIKLVFSLGLSDILLIISIVSHKLNKVFSPFSPLSSNCMEIFFFALNTMAITISLLNLFAMAVDHYLAIMNPLHYSQYLSRSNGNILIVTIWLISFAAGLTVYIGDISAYQHSTSNSYCEFLHSSVYHGEYLVIAIAFISFVFITYTYLRIYAEVRRVYRHGPSGRLDYARNRKALLTTLVIVGTFIICWLPTCLLQVTLSILAQVNRAFVVKHLQTFLKLNRYLNTLMPLNTLCDPIVYAVRLRDVQQGYRRLFHMCFFFRAKRQGSAQNRSGFTRQSTQVGRLLTGESMCTNSIVQLEFKDDLGSNEMTCLKNHMNGNKICLSDKQDPSVNTDHL